jgi:hypothetical protein
MCFIEPKRVTPVKGTASISPRTSPLADGSITSAQPPGEALKIAAVSGIDLPVVYVNAVPQNCKKIESESRQLLRDSSRLQLLEPGQRRRGISFAERLRRPGVTAFGIGNSLARGQITASRWEATFG